MRATSAPVVLPEKNGSGPFYLPAGNKCAVLFFPCRKFIGSPFLLFVGPHTAFS